MAVASPASGAAASAAAEIQGKKNHLLVDLFFHQTNLVEYISKYYVCLPITFVAGWLVLQLIPTPDSQNKSRLPKTTRVAIQHPARENGARIAISATNRGCIKGSGYKNHLQSIDTLLFEWV